MELKSAGASGKYCTGFKMTIGNAFSRFMKSQHIQWSSGDLSQVFLMQRNFADENQSCRYRPIVVVPLIALIKDQVDAFNRRGRRMAVAIHFNMSSAQIREATALTSSGATSGGFGGGAQKAQERGSSGSGRGRR
jgi:hypothetical protein